MVTIASDKNPEVDELLIEDYKLLSGKLLPGLPPMRGIGHTIDTGTDPPVSKPA